MLRELGEKKIASDGIRPIHYLGSKLRMLDAVKDAVELVESNGLPICDLFSGSGTVSSAFRFSRDVYAVDIQEYSRVLCSAILKPFELPVSSISNAVSERVEALEIGAVGEALNTLYKFEEKCLNQAEAGEPLALCEMLEDGSISRLERGFPSKNNNIELESALKGFLVHLSDSSSCSGSDFLILRQFGGLYFSYSQAFKLDCIRAVVSDLPESQRDTAKSALLTTASVVVNSVGKHFAQPIRPRTKAGEAKTSLYRAAYKDRVLDVEKIFAQTLFDNANLQASRQGHKAIRADYQDVLNDNSLQFGVVYADPPYTRDHYSRFYHVLETICLNDNPEISTQITNGVTGLSRGLYRLDRHQSPFCIRSKAPQAFEGLIKGTRQRNIPLIISYSAYAADKNAHPRVMALSGILDIARKYYNSVEVISAGKFSHSKLNHKVLNKEINYDAEQMILMTI